MFEQTFIDEPGGGVKTWAVAASFLMQCLLLTAAVVMPLLFSYNPPMGDWVRHALLLAPPPPPLPAAPRPATQPVAPAPARFDAVLAAPTAIPQNVALVKNDERSSLAGLRAPDLGGVRGGAGGVPDGVLGVTGSMTGIVPPKPLRLGGKVQAAKIVSQVRPMYPPEAAEQGIGGTVKLEAIITATGTIREIKVLSGEPLLADSALEAVRQWRYRPTYLNGQAVEVITQIEVNFVAAPIEPQDKNHKKKKKR